MFAVLTLAGPASALPPAPPPAMERLLGQYGEADHILTVYESGGDLFAEGYGRKWGPLTPLGKGRYGFMKALPDGPPANGRYQADISDFAFEGHGPGAVLVINGDRFTRHDFGAEVVATIQAKVKADPARVRAEALAAQPPTETGKRPADLVALATIDPRIRLDIRYATANNFMGFPLYERPGAYMQRPAAEALGRAQTALAAQGYGLVIHDAYRPWFVTKMFWEATPPDSRIFVADPAKGSKHNRGCAVDLSLYDLKTGKPVEMPSRYDEMSTRSYADFLGGTSRQRALRAILRTAMEAQGYTVLSEEWWHFDYRDWASYGIGAVTFSELAQR